MGKYGESMIYFGFLTLPNFFQMNLRKMVTAFPLTFKQLMLQQDHWQLVQEAQKGTIRHLNPQRKRETKRKLQESNFI